MTVILWDIDYDVLKELGYETQDEQYAITQKIKQHYPPKNIRGTEALVKWAEFIRGIEEDDFTLGDTFWIGNVKLEVVK